MPLDISFAQFDAIASGKYNAGQIDYKGEGAKATIKKVNAHVHTTGMNTVVVDAKRTVELKQAFVKAMSARLDGNANAIAEIRKELGLPPSDINPKAITQRTVEPLTRQEVRNIIDKYVNGGNTGPVKADVATKREEVNLANQRALPIRIGTQTFRLDKMAAELAKVGKGDPTKSQAMDIVKLLMRPDGKLDAATFARSMNIFSYMAEEAAKADAGGKNAGARMEAAFSRALDSLDNGALTQVYQGLISRDAEALKGEFRRRLGSFNLSMEQADVCKRTALAMGRLEALVVSEISHRVVLGNAKTPEERAEISLQAPVLQHCGEDVQRDLEARNTDGEMTSVNLGIVSTRAAYGSIQASNLADKTSEDLVKLGFTKADAHDIGDVMRKSELTVNAHLSNILGWREGQDPENPPLYQPGYSLVNTFVSKEQKGMAADGSGYLVRRDKVEQHFFPEYGQVNEFQGKDRPVYAAINLTSEIAGAASTGPYGDVVFVMKEHVKQQATYTLSDTFYALKFDFNQESKAKFLAKVQEYFSRFVKPEVLEQLSDPSTQYGGVIDRFFKSRENRGIMVDKELQTSDPIKGTADFLNEHRLDGAREVDSDDMMAVLFDAIGAKDDELSRVAGYDNIENLLANLKDMDPLLVGLGAARKMANPDAPVKFVGGEYIEAQLHGPIVVARDVAEMRVQIENIEDHYKDLATDNPAVTGGMDKKEWVAQKVNADVARLRQFGDDNGFKVSFYCNTGNNRTVAFENLNKDVREVKAMMQGAHTEYVRDFVDANVKDLMRTVFSWIAEEDRPVATELFGDGFDAAPDWLVEIAKTAGTNKALETVNNLRSTSGYQKEELRGMARAGVMDAMRGVMECISAARTLGAEDNTKVFALIKDAYAAGLTGSKAMNAVAAKLVQERIMTNPQAIIEETLAKELSARSEEIASIGFPGGFKIDGMALRRILTKVQEHLETFKRAGADLAKTNTLIDEIRQKIIAPEISSRLDLLKSIDANSFPDANMKDSYFGWVMNAGRIKSAEELKGVKDSAEGLYQAFSTLLAQKNDFGATDFMNVLKEVVGRIDRAMAADSAANYQGAGQAFGTDDRNGYISRAISVGLGAIEKNPDLGRPALQKLAGILAKPEITNIFNALTTGVDPKIQTRIEGGSAMSFYYTAHYALLDRITEKYGLVTGPTRADLINYSQVSPEVREKLAMIAPAFVAELDTKIPYAPQTTKTMPAALNPEAAPKTLAERKRALMEALPTYATHEQSFDRGRNTHGRGHATRVFIFANTLGNIMRERGVSVDLGALSISAAGHDMGRKGGGKDVWEADSALLTSNLAERTYPGAYGEEWKTQTRTNIDAGHDADADSLRSVEGLLFKAADSLDYTRVDKLDPKRFHFLEKSLNVGGVNVMQDENLRASLMHEAELLTKATSPVAAKLDEIQRLKLSENEAERVQGRAIEAEATNAEIQLANLSDEEVVERIEKEIRDNPTKYPLLTKYYLNAE